MRTFQQAPQFCARAAGVAYLLIIALGLFGESYVRGRLIVPGDGLATVAHIAASPGLWRLDIAGDLLMHLLDVPLIVFFHLLLRSVNRELALVSTALNLVQTSVLAANKLTLVATLLLATASAQHSGLPSWVLAPLVSLTTSLHGYGFGIGLLFFGLTCLVRGHLIVKSGLFPPVLGWLLFIAGMVYLINSAALLTAPAIASVLFPWILVPAFLGELALALWLAVRGVSMSGWENLNDQEPSPASAAQRVVPAGRPRRVTKEPSP